MADGDSRVSPRAFLKQAETPAACPRCEIGPERRRGPRGSRSWPRAEALGCPAACRERNEAFPPPAARSWRDESHRRPSAAIDRFDDDRLVNLPGQWKLHQNSMDGRVGVESIDRRKQLGLRRLGRKSKNVRRSSRPPCTRPPCSGRKPGWPDLLRPGRRSSPGRPPSRPRAPRYRSRPAGELFPRAAFPSRISAGTNFLARHRARRSMSTTSSPLTIHVLPVPRLPLGHPFDGRLEPRERVSPRSWPR